MNPDKIKPVIGLAGGIGAGKSLVADEFARLGCEVIDGDAIGHELLSLPEVCQMLRHQWGDGIFNPDGSVNRQALGRIVFDDRDALDRLNGILHPLIRRRIEERIAMADRNAAVPAIVLDAAVLFEAKWDDLCTHLVFVQAPGDSRAARVVQRGWDRRTWASRENSQISLDKKAARCQYSIDNSSSEFYLREQVHQLFRQLVPLRNSPL